MSKTVPAAPLLFVYGTLLHDSGSDMAAFMRRNTSNLGSGYFFGRLYDLGAYPGAVATPGEGGKVHGQVYQLHHAAAVLPVLDAYEETGPGFSEPYLFVREMVKVFTNGTSRDCWVYLYNGATDEAASIHSGDFLVYLKGKR